MAEYIINVGNADEKHIELTGAQAETCFGHPLNEQVVRCKSCKWAIADGYSCSRFDYCDVEPNGFCSWGERDE